MAKSGKKQELLNIGEIYQGDGVKVRTGETVTVSAEKATQLLSDFPLSWTKDLSFRDTMLTPEKAQAETKSEEDPDTDAKE